MPASYNTRLGQQGEEAACVYLLGQGYTLLARNYRAGKLGEIDSVWLHPNQQALCFVEVKTRRTAHVATGLQALTPTKARHLQQAIATFIEDATVVKPTKVDAWQVDWVLVTALPHVPTQCWAIELIENVLWVDDVG